MKLTKGKVIGALAILVILAAAFWYGGNAPGLQGWTVGVRESSPVLEELKNEIGDAARIAKIDVDQHEELAARYRIQAVPTFIVFKKGEAVWRHSGVISGKDLKAVIEQNS